MKKLVMILAAIPLLLSGPLVTKASAEVTCPPTGQVLGLSQATALSKVCDLTGFAAVNDLTARGWFGAARPRGFGRPGIA